ncbi:MAG: DinB family protein, partial [Patescibacteria group bacterium]|nr:DinB family protein [Patescibacteria group bacterium]
MTTVPTESIKKSKIHLEQFDKTRSQTLELVQPLEKEDYVVQTAFFMSPPKWHLGHVSWFYEVKMSKIDPNYKFFSKHYSKIFN